MLKKTNEYVELNLSELFGVESDGSMSGVIRDISTALTGQGDSIRIVDPDDNAQSIYFGSVELLKRYASVASLFQLMFLRKIKSVMASQNVSEMRLQIPWARNRVRTLKIEILSNSLHLNLL